MKQEELKLSKTLWEELAPFSIIFNRVGEVTYLSRRILDMWKLSGDEDRVIAKVTSELTLSRPFESQLTFDLFPHLTNLLIHLELSSMSGRSLRGQLYNHGEEWLFSGFPMVSNLTELEKLGIMLSDLPLNTGLGERLIANEANTASLIESKVTAEKLGLANKEQAIYIERVAKFVPEKFIQDVGINSILDAELGGHVESNRSILFADLLGFTQISQGLTSGEIFKVINQYLSCTVPCIENNGGFVIHYLGDGIMALFPSGDDSALKAAIEMQKALKMCQGEHSPYSFELKMSIGIHEGPVALGIVGNENRWDASIISDAVNTSARIEAKTRVLGGELLVSREFINASKIKGGFRLRSLGQHDIRGRSGQTELIEVMDSLDDSVYRLRQRTLPDFNYGVAAYVADDIYLAMSCFSRVLSVTPDDRAAQYYLALIAKSIANEKL
jgi:class 3 adenylate cyclase